MAKIKSFYKCKHCGDEIMIDTGGKMVFCRCGKFGIDGNEFYVRVLGEPNDFEIIEK
jgi:hypothetical protein